MASLETLTNGIKKLDSASGNAGVALNDNFSAIDTFIGSTNSSLSDKLENVSEDTSPQLGGDLDPNGNLVGAASAADLTKLAAITVSATEVNHLSGVSSNVQTQLNGKMVGSNNLSEITDGLTCRFNINAIGGVNEDTDPYFSTDVDLPFGNANFSYSYANFNSSGGINLYSGTILGISPGSYLGVLSYYDVQNLAYLAQVSQYLVGVSTYVQTAIDTLYSYH